MQPPADPRRVNPNILATPATPRACYPWPAASISAASIRTSWQPWQPPAGVLSLARGVNQRKESGCNPPADPRRRQSEHPGNPGNPAGVLSLARGVNQRKESGCNPR